MAEVSLPEVQVYTDATQAVHKSKLIKIISKQDIEKSKSVTLVDVLNKFAPGSVSSYSSYFNSGIYLQGASPHSTIILLNGVKVSDSTKGSFDIGHIALTAVEKIELIANSDGVVYGSQAVIGAINIVTKVATNSNQLEAKAEYGSNNSSVQELGYLTNTNNSNFSMFVFNSASSGYSMSNNSQNSNEKDGYNKQTVLARYILSNLNNGELEFLINYAQTYTQYDPFTSKRQFPYFYLKDTNNVEANRHDYLGYIKYNFNLLSTNNKFTFSYNHVNRKEYEDFVEMGFLDPKNNQYKSTSVNINYSIEKDYNNWVIKTGVDKDVANFKENIGLRSYEFRNETRVFGLETTSHTQEINSAYSIVNYNASNNLSLTSGIRYSNISKYKDNNKFNYNAGFVYTGDFYKLRSNYFLAYKSPNLFELYSYENGALVDKQPNVFVFSNNNNNLRQERNKGFNVGVDASFLDNKFNSSLTYFSTAINNLIILKYDISSASTFGEPQKVYYNRPDEVIISGVVFNNKFNWHQYFNIDVNYNYLYFNKQLPRRPKHAASVILTSNISKYTFTVNMVAVSAKLEGFDTPEVVVIIPGRPPVSYPSYNVADWKINGYVLLNAGVSYAINNNFSLYSKAVNILNKDYQNAYGFKGEPRGVYAGIKWQN